MTDSDRITAVFTGQVRDRWPGKPPSAIAKTRRDGAVAVGATGLVGDAQADLSVHGGVAKAIHVYPAAHYPEWRRDLGDNPVFAPGGFGENISLPNWTEADVCIGDVLRMGSARVVVSQGRQPCWKLSAHAGDDRLAWQVRRTLRTGWYLRVVEAGAVAAGGTITLLERPLPDWTVRRVAAALFDPHAPIEKIAPLAGMSALDPTWRGVFAERLSRQEAQA
ncbi:MOSC domain-containing protein [Jannaschia sp. 2305UL9-9]|uniref:MOSC domain-containing protein n=1 Tax=Jannaschia sp. 2305UL9-9 TaxID=3121638 RepID=UPI003527DF46